MFPFILNGKIIVWCLISNTTFSLVVFCLGETIDFYKMSTFWDPLWVKTLLSFSNTHDIFKSTPCSENPLKMKYMYEKINTILSRVSFLKHCLINVVVLNATLLLLAGLSFFFIAEPQLVLMFGHVPQRAERWKTSPELTKYFKKTEEYNDVHFSDGNRT